MMKHVADGIYRNTESGVCFERPWIDGRRTWRSLETENLKLAKEELHRRRAAVKQNGHNALLVEQIIQQYQKDDYPDAQRLRRPARMHSLEEKNCQNLLPFWARVKVADVSLAECDRYHDWRCERIKRGLGHRAVDLDLNTLSNAFIWATRCEIVQSNPIIVWSGVQVPLGPLCLRKLRKVSVHFLSPFCWSGRGRQQNRFSTYPRCAQWTSIRKMHNPPPQSSS